jgi:hypothetical protein
MNAIGRNAHISLTLVTSDIFLLAVYYHTPLTSVAWSCLSPIVRPTKKPTNFGPIRGVPKSGVWRVNRKKYSMGMAEKVGLGNRGGGHF